jgi:hypothetical protein
MITHYGWKEAHAAAVLESDDGKLHDRIRTAKTAIHQRLHELHHDDGDQAIKERLALSKALVELYLLRQVGRISEIPERHED